MTRTLYGFMFTAISLVVISCQPQNAPQAQPERAIPPIGPMPHAEPSATPTVMPPTDTPVPAPVFPAAQVARSLLLSSGETPDCELPCWEGLRVGQSTQNDVQRVFTRVLNADASVDFFSLSTEADLWLQNEPQPANGYIGGQFWDFRDPAAGTGAIYMLYAVIDQGTNHLMALVEHMGAFNDYDVPALPLVVLRLGTPDWATIEDSRTNAVFNLVMYYRQGIRAAFSISEQQLPDAATQVCFDGIPVTEAYLLVDPYTSADRQNMTPMQRAWERGAPAPGLADRLHMSLGDFAALVTTADHPCLQLPQ